MGGDLDEGFVEDHLGERGVLHGIDDAEPVHQGKSPFCMAQLVLVLGDLVPGGVELGLLCGDGGFGGVELFLQSSGQGPSGGLFLVCVEFVPGGVELGLVGVELLSRGRDLLLPVGDVDGCGVTLRLEGKGVVDGVDTVDAGPCCGEFCDGLLLFCGEGLAVGGPDDDGSDACGSLREVLFQIVDDRLEFSPWDGELGGEGPPQGGGSGAGEQEKESPGEDDSPGVTRCDSSESVQVERHAGSFPRAPLSWWTALGVCWLGCSRSRVANTRVLVVSRERSRRGIVCRRGRRGVRAMPYARCHRRSCRRR